MSAVVWELLVRNVRHNSKGQTPELLHSFTINSELLIEQFLYYKPGCQWGGTTATLYQFYWLLPTGAEMGYTNELNNY